MRSGGSATAPLVLLHGFTGAPASFERLRRDLPEGSAVFAPVLTGHTLAPPMAASFEAEVDRLAGGVAEIGSTPCHLAGYSLGGRLALGLALDHPDLVSSLTLMSSHPGLSDEAERRDRARADDDLARLIEDRGIEGFLETWQAQPLFASQRALPAALLEEQRRVRTAHRPEGLAHALRVLGLGKMPCFFDALPTLAMPVTVLTGRRDPKFVEIAERIRTRLPEAHWICLEDVGHNVILEAPERVAECLNRILLLPRT